MSQLSRALDHLRDRHGDTWEFWWSRVYYARRWGDTDILKADTVRELERLLTP